MKGFVSVLRFLMVVCAVFFVCSCVSDAGERFKIAWCVADVADESEAFFTRISREHADEVGVDLVVYDGQSDPQRQSNQIGNAIASGCQAVIINPIDAHALIPAFQRAKDAGLVVICSQNMLVSDGEEFDVFVGIDNKITGILAAKEMMRHFPDGAKIVIIEGMAGSTPQIHRSEGFLETIEGTNIEILDRQSSPWSTAEAMSIMEDFLARFPEIDGVYCHWDNGMVGVIEALKGANRMENMVLISVDGNQNGFDMVRSGETQASIFLNFEEMARKGIDAAVALLKGEKVEKHIIPDPIVITKENVDEYHTGW